MAQNWWDDPFGKPTAPRLTWGDYAARNAPLAPTPWAGSTHGEPNTGMGGAPTPLNPSNYANIPAAPTWDYRSPQANPTPRPGDPGWGGTVLFADKPKQPVATGTGPRVPTLTLTPNRTVTTGQGAAQPGETPDWTIQNGKLKLRWSTHQEGVNLRLAREMAVNMREKGMDEQAAYNAALSSVVGMINGIGAADSTFSILPMEAFRGMARAVGQAGYNFSDENLWKQYGRQLNWVNAADNGTPSPSPGMPPPVLGSGATGAGYQQTGALPIYPQVIRPDGSAGHSDTPLPTGGAWFDAPRTTTYGPVEDLPGGGQKLPVSSGRGGTIRYGGGQPVYGPAQDMPGGGQRTTMIGWDDDGDGRVDRPVGGQQGGQGMAVLPGWFNDFQRDNQGGYLEQLKKALNTVNPYTGKLGSDIPPRTGTADPLAPRTTATPQPNTGTANPYNAPLRSQMTTTGGGTGGGTWPGLGDAGAGFAQGNLGDMMLAWRAANGLTGPNRGGRRQRSGEQYYAKVLQLLASLGEDADGPALTGLINQIRDRVGVGGSAGSITDIVRGAGQRALEGYDPLELGGDEAMEEIQRIGAALGYGMGSMGLNRLAFQQGALQDEYDLFDLYAADDPQGGFFEKNPIANSPYWKLLQQLAGR